jgi:hypothetical protein
MMKKAQEAKVAKLHELQGIWERVMSLICVTE